MKLGIKFEDGSSRVSGLGAYLIRSVVGRLLFSPHLDQSWWDTRCPVRIEELYDEAANKLPADCSGFVMMAADPHSNTVTLTVPRFAPASSKIIFDLDHYNEAIEKEGWPALVLSCDLFDSWDCVNPNTITELDSAEPAEPEKTQKSE